jgi:hypothetical protein
VRGDRVGLQRGLVGWGRGGRSGEWVLHRSCALRRNVSLDALRRELTGRRASQRHSHAERGNDKKPDA